ncbi:hypothetical protein [Chitinophaga nivalis]|uniref:FecR protein domain-containing protein n=1 Tax=Chitinophaga nivalis TaxID=2991709 RepID=A0ABT3IMB6_9BACT|nr:hypothetical protein [Chitinophaga nivalis]MCW3465190.1 hypothetical protein [Chitinophaga nivalis]MCW3485118.1 hypothetical protein [Chitinophaga nivalis]
MDIDKRLLEKYYKGYCNEAEKAAIAAWLQAGDAFTGTPAAAGDPGAKNRMWDKIRCHTVEEDTGQQPPRTGFQPVIRLYYSYIAVACTLLLLVGGIYVWQQVNLLPDENTYVIIDNTSKQLLTPQQVGKIRLSESANSAWQHIAMADDKSYQLFTNSLIIDNRHGDDTWVYLKTSSGKEGGMVKFLCKKKRAYVAGFITECTEKGNRKYLYAKQAGTSMLPEAVSVSLNSQLNAVNRNDGYKGCTTIII